MELIAPRNDNYNVKYSADDATILGGRREASFPSNVSFASPYRGERMNVENDTPPSVDNTTNHNNTSPSSTGSTGSSMAYSIPPAAFSTPENVTPNEESRVLVAEYEGAPFKPTGSVKRRSLNQDNGVDPDL